VELPASTVGALVVLAIALGVVALGVAANALQGQKRVRDAYRQFSQGSREDVLTLLSRHVAEVEGLRRDVARQREYGESLRALIATGLSRIGTVRYDAFDDMGGRMSFSTAILDEHGDGVVLSSINGRAETRTYAKPIAAYTSPHNLASEEVEAIRRARERIGRTDPADSGPAERVRGVPVAAGRRSAPRGTRPTARPGTADGRDSVGVPHFESDFDSDTDDAHAATNPPRDGAEPEPVAPAAER